ncbi:hypothetical protein Y032_0484g2316 [Ancylostoma ceylanicum]|uniref:Uncharacterized protein n=1 Tax=Ancylostoma ceylanicum TaxID=53326 RepID=A0A016WXE3_9BILA|nr:hypothetical protein Y032_0484g2316 [Ancylostoma ceylanicum]
MLRETHSSAELSEVLVNGTGVGQASSAVNLASHLSGGSHPTKLDAAGPVAVSSSSLLGLSLSALHEPVRPKLGNGR